MEQHRPMLVVSEEVQKLPLLILDKKGIIGAALAQKLQEEFLVVLVSDHPKPEELIHKNIILIPYKKRIPLIPDNNYSHMFLIYNGEKEVLDMLPAFVRKANQTNGRLFFITSLFHGSHSLYTTLSHHAYHNVQVLIFGETFDNKLTEANTINFYIHQARVYGRIELANSGLSRVYPIAFHDVISAIIATAFVMQKRYKCILIFPHHSTTDVSVARMFQKVDPNIKIDFINKKKKSQDLFVPRDGIFFFPNYDLEGRLKEVDLTRKTSPITPVPQNKIKLALPKKRAKNPFTTVLTMLIVLVLFPTVSTFLLLLIGASSLQTAVKQAEAMKFSSAHADASTAKTAFSLANVMSSGLILINTPFHAQAEKLVEDIQTGEEVSTMALDMLSAADTIQGIYQGKSTDEKADFFRATATFKDTLLKLQQLRAENKIPESFIGRLDKFQYAIELAENTLDLWPSLLGFEGEKKYLVLFQNNMELRPGGGFIGSYGILTMKNGKADTFHIFDVYDADGKLKTHVEPPYALRRYLGASNWFLRDSNFDIDFTKDATEATRFLKEETGQTVDGVIAIDTSFLQNILKAMGSVTVADYNETVTPDNFYLLTQTHAEKDFFPGSTQKKDFLKGLSNAMIMRLSEGKKISNQELLSEVITSIKQRHVLFSFNDQNAQNIFTVNNITSSLWDGRKRQDSTFQDYLGIVEANVGTNKVNYYIKRTWDYAASIDETGNFQGKTTVGYQNTSKRGSPYGGDYKNYVRFILPPNAVVQSVTIDNKELPIVPAITDPAIYTQKEFVPPSGLEIEQTEEKGKTIVGFFHIVPVGASQTVAITYTVQQVIDPTRPSFLYDLQLFKQPGTTDDPYSVSFAYPSSFRLITEGEKARDVGGKVIESGDLLQDTNLKMEFSKK